MATIPFTARIEQDLKIELDKIARYERRSAGFMANQAIRNLVEERMATRALVETGLALVAMNAPSVPATEMHDWLFAEEDLPFPKGRVAS
jgi:predicted transcriptional regulator